MSTISILLVVAGIWMAYSGYLASWKMRHFHELSMRGIEATEYNYHILFRAIWWIPVAIGILIIIFSK